MCSLGGLVCVCVREGVWSGSQLCILTLVDIVLWDPPPHLRICK